ncbi:MAG: rhomboid family intramembrane serine protease [Terriglobia bacterium]
MRYDTRYRSRSSQFYWSFPPGVKWLIFTNIAIYLVDFFALFFSGDEIFAGLKLVPAQVIHGAVWQPVTYLFLHSLGGPGHLIFNMLALWMFGAPIEETWGTKRFIRYYFLCGIGAGICVVAANLAWGDPRQSTIGASGAIYGLLLAFGMLFPEQEILIAFLFPIKAKYMVMIFGGIAFVFSFQRGSTVSNLAHLGGMIFGFLYIRTQFGRKRRALPAGPGFSWDLKRRWKDFKLQRAKKKFQVYMKKHGSDRGPFVN